MKQQKILFIDRDGTLIVEPPSQQIDSLDKLQLMPDVINSLLKFKEAGFLFVMITNQDGLGTQNFPEEDFNVPQQFMLELFATQGITFEAIRICPHVITDNCQCRKPNIGLVLDYLSSQVIDRDNSYVIGDRLTDVQLADKMRIKGIRLGDEQTPDWQTVVSVILNNSKKATVSRKTNETDITLTVDLANSYLVAVNTGIPFFDHMLSQLAQHGKFGLIAKVKGDLQVDDHHTVEDTALVLGEALSKALGDKRGIGRYGFVLPMDEALAQVAIDICGRPYFIFEGKFTQEKIGTLSTECVPHFFRSFAQSLGAAMHITMKGENTHHMIESLFKAVGRSLRQALSFEGGDIPSTKGVL